MILSQLRPRIRPQGKVTIFTGIFQIFVSSQNLSYNSFCNFLTENKKSKKDPRRRPAPARSHCIEMHWPD
jgi:hypothetical protein